MKDTKTTTILISVTLLLVFTVASLSMAADVTWTRKSNTTGDLPAPSDGKQQTCCLILDIDKDGINDFVIGERTRTPSVVWYKYNGKGWDKFVIDNTRLNPEAGGDNAVWWWENPYPNFKKPWARRFIKNSGARKHHDQAFGDFDGDGDVEFLSWNQDAKSLLLFEIPEDTKTIQIWPSIKIYSWSSGQEREGFPSIPVDIDLDGQKSPGWKVRPER